MISLNGRSIRNYKFLIAIYTVIVILIFQYYCYVKYNQDNGEFNRILCSFLSIVTDKHISFDDSSYSIEHYPEFICPQNFRNMADWIYGWPENIFDEKVQNSDHQIRATVASLPHGSILYVKTDSLSDFFTNIYPYFRHKFVLITGQGDLAAPSQYLHYLEEKNSKIIHWFGQNGDIDASRNERFTHIPIGINCFEMATSIRNIHQQYLNSTLPSIQPQSIDQPSHYIQPFDITENVLKSQIPLKKILLINFKPDTDYTGIRSEIWKEMCAKNQSSFATCYTKSEGVDISVLPSVYQRNRRYPLWLSPRGNGLDCHRTWEALYLDVIPIVWHSTLDSLYANLPIIIIHNWKEINEQFLREKLKEIAQNKLQRPFVYQYEKLRNTFWYQMILSKSRYAFLNNPMKRNRCWRAKSIRSNK